MHTHARLKVTAMTSTCTTVTMATGCVKKTTATAAGVIITKVSTKHNLYFIDENKYIT